MSITPSSATTLATPATLPFLPWAIVWQFPSGEFMVENHQTEEGARKAASEAAQEATGRVVHVVRRVAAVVQPPNALIWGAV